MSSNTLIENLMNYSVNMRKKELFLFETIEQETADAFVKGLSLLDNTSNKEGLIHVKICSPGGDVYAMFAIFDAIRNCKCTVRTTAYGWAMSAAVPILAAGDHGFRCCMPNTWLMFHSVSGLAEFHSPSQLTADATHTAELQSRMCRMLADRTNRDARWWSNVVRKSSDTYFSPAEAMRIGLVDKIL